MLYKGKSVGNQNIDDIPTNDSHRLLLGPMMRNSWVFKDLKPFVWQGTIRKIDKQFFTLVLWPRGIHLL